MHTRGSGLCPLTSISTANSHARWPRPLHPKENGSFLTGVRLSVCLSSTQCLAAKVLALKCRLQIISCSKPAVAYGRQRAIPQGPCHSPPPAPRAVRDGRDPGNRPLLPSARGSLRPPPRPPPHPPSARNAAALLCSVDEPFIYNGTVRENLSSPQGPADARGFLRGTPRENG